LRVRIPLVGGLAQPRERPRVVLRYAQAKFVHLAEGGLRVGIALFGRRTPEPHRRRVIAAPIRSEAVLKWVRDRSAKQAEREKAASKEAFDPPFHGSLALGTRAQHQ
jgi:hypothetical protein